MTNKNITINFIQPGATSPGSAGGWQMFFGVSVCSLLMVIAAGLAYNQRQRLEGVAAREPQTPQVIVSEASTSAELVTQYTSEPPVWRQVTIDATTSADPNDLIFTLEGEEVATPIVGREYYLVDRDLYENFVPTSVDDLILLQLPNTTFRPVSRLAGFVVLPHRWRIPEGIEGFIDFQVDSWDGNDLAAGEYVDRTATVWIVPWEYTHPLANPGSWQ